MISKSATYQKGNFKTYKDYAINSPSYKTEHSVTEIRKFIGSLKPHKKILDLGCADGELLSEFCGTHQIYGVDIAKNLLKIAQKNGLKTVCGDIEKQLSYADSFFDLIVCHHVIEHVLDTDRLLSECNRVLKPKGKVLLTFPNVNTPISFIFSLLDLPAYQGARYRSTHLRDFTLRTVRIALLNNGFKVRENLGGPFLNRSRYGYFNFITKIWPQSAVDLTLVAQKFKEVKMSRKPVYDHGADFKSFLK